MSDITDAEGPSRSGAGTIIGVAAACVACCIGPLLALPGAIAALGAAAAFAIGATALVVAAAAVAAVLTARRRRGSGACAVPSEPVVVELRRRP